MEAVEDHAEKINLIISVAYDKKVATLKKTKVVQYSTRKRGIVTKSPVCKNIAMVLKRTCKRLLEI